MKSRLSLIFVALIVLLGAMVWLVQDRPSRRPVPVMAASLPATSLAPAPAASDPTQSAPAVQRQPIAPPTHAAPTVSVDASGNLNYVARSGDTVSQLAIALLGSDSKANRDAIIAANPSLQANPDRVLDGHTYSISVSTAGGTSEPTASAQSDALTRADNAAAVETPSAPELEPGNTLRPAVPVATGPQFKYTARSGDSVSVLAGNLLGGNTKANRDSIIAGNASLKQDPDHLVAGKRYTIAAPNGLSADPNAPQAPAVSSEPDADELAQLSVGRTLQYTARPGDTVSNLAVALLGSDTADNRQLIIKSNPTLKQNPDHLVAGQTYWIAAPSAPTKP